jgi:hypothetical protein
MIFWHYIFKGLIWIDNSLIYHEMAIHPGFVSVSCHKGKAVPRNIPMLSWGEKWD